MLVSKAAHELVLCLPINFTLGIALLSVEIDPILFQVIGLGV